jgi:hypothetical protein
MGQIRMEWNLLHILSNAASFSLSFGYLRVTGVGTCAHALNVLMSWSKVGRSVQCVEHL